MAGLDRGRGRPHDRRVDRLRESERRNHAHAFSEHVDVGPADTRRRAATGVNARGVREVPPPQDATRWTSERALSRVSQALWRSPDAVRRRTAQEAAGLPPEQAGFSVREPLNVVLGAQWRKHVDGHSSSSGGRSRSEFTERSEAVAVFRRNAAGDWYLYTCYPQVAARRARRGANRSGS